MSARQGVRWRPCKNRRLQAWPCLFPTRSTFFNGGMRHRHLLQAKTYNRGLSRPLSNRINWCTGPFSTVPTGSWIPAHAFLWHIPVPSGVLPVLYGSLARGSRVDGGLGYSCSTALSWLKTKIAVWRILLIPWVPKYQDADQQKIPVVEKNKSIVFVFSCNCCGCGLYFHCRDNDNIVTIWPVDCER